MPEYKYVCPLCGYERWVRDGMLVRESTKCLRCNHQMKEEA